MQRLVVFLIIAILLITSILLFSWKTRHFSSTRFRAMGTEVLIKVNGRGAPEHIFTARSTIKRLSNIFSRHTSKSELSRLNQEINKLKKVRVSPELFTILKKAKQVSQITKGAFDVTLSNFKNLKLDQADNTIFFTKTGNQIDLDGIGKGYAVEEARKALLERGVEQALISMVSSVAVIGGPFKIGIKNPQNKEQVIHVVELKDGEALSTSGSYEQGKHIINPKTGDLVETCQSVTVVARDAAFADALSTAIYVLGPEKGRKLLEKIDGIRTIIVTSEGKILEING